MKLGVFLPFATPLADGAFLRAVGVSPGQYRARFSRAHPPANVPGRGASRTRRPS